MSMSDEIEEFMLTTFKTEGFEDTDENRLAFLKGIQDAWKEDDEELSTDEAMTKVLYQVTLTGMIAVQQLKLRPSVI